MIYLFGEINYFKISFHLDLKAKRDEVIQCHINQIDGVWTCNICDRSSKNRAHIVEHIEAKHIDDGESYVCTICGKLQRTRQVYRTHFAKDHSNLPSYYRKLILC